MNEQLPQWLAARLAQPLPGPMVGSRFEPHPRPWRHYDVAPPDARQAAVLVLFYPHEGQWYLPLTLRPAHMVDHAAQVSLPGGAIEPGETAAQAALREFHEELGDDGLPIELLGRLSPHYVQASNYLVTPWVAVAQRGHGWSPIQRRWKRCSKCRSATCWIRPISAAKSASTKATPFSLRTSSSSRTASRAPRA